VVPILPGLLLVVGAVVLWAILEGGALAWGVAILALAIATAGTFIKFAIPKRRLNESGVENSTLLLATAASVVGLFVIPVVGAPIGFVATIYLTERARGGPEQAWPRTKESLRAVATSMGIELVTGLVIAAIWFAAAVLG
jgi:ABC-type phosphate transport system permease subunit